MNSKVLKFIIYVVLTVAVVAYFWYKAEQPQGALMTDQQAIDKSFKQFESILDEGDVIAKVTFKPRSGAGLTKEADLLEVLLYEADKDSLYGFEIGINPSGDKYLKKMDFQSSQYQREKKRHPKNQAIAFKDIDISHLAEYINDAAAQVVEAGEGEEKPFRFDGLGNYTIELNSDTAKIVHNFTIRSKESTKTAGRIQTIEYTEFPFVVKNGQLKIK